MLDTNGGSLKDQLSAAKKTIRELEKTISDLTDKWTMSQAAVSVLEKQLSKALTNETSAANELQSARLNETTLQSEIDQLRQQLSKLGANPQQSSSPHLKKGTRSRLLIEAAIG
jgi:chromosome segregation ATPase